MNVVKELMDHADISTTAVFYSAVSKEHEVQAQLVIEAMTVGVNRGTTDAQVTPEVIISPIRRVG